MRKGELKGKRMLEVSPKSNLTVLDGVELIGSLHGLCLLDLKGALRVQNLCQKLFHLI